MTSLRTFILGVAGLTALATNTLAQTPASVTNDPRLANLNGKVCEGRYQVIALGPYAPDRGKMKLTFIGATVRVEINKENWGRGYEDRGVAELVPDSGTYKFEAVSKQAGSGSIFTILFKNPQKLELKGKTASGGSPIEASLECR